MKILIHSRHAAEHIPKCTIQVKANILIHSRHAAEHATLSLLS